MQLGTMPSCFEQVDKILVTKNNPWHEIVMAIACNDATYMNFSSIQSNLRDISFSNWFYDSRM